jgi:ABC-type branched-subunit amino acid transport system substrate-binding protein
MQALGGRLLLAAFLALSLAACGPADGAPARPDPVRLYGADGNMSNAFGLEFRDRPGLLAGMKGTAPLTALTESFKTRLQTVSPELDDFAYAAETYDAVVISALAAELAGTTRSRQLAPYVNGVTTAGRMCDSVAACLALARAGRDLHYRGVSLRRGGFTDAGEPAAASYATLHFGQADRLDQAKTEFVGAGDDSATTRQRPPAPHKRRKDAGAPLRIGGLLPYTGDQALQLPPMRTGAELAVAEINEAGGVLGKPVEWIEGDDGTNPAVARRTIAAHVAAGVDVIIGAGASGVTRAVLSDVLAAGVVLFSPSNTAADLSNDRDQGLYFRTAPSDVLQGRALADVILRDGAQRVAIIARDDAYGTGLADIVRAELERAGLPPTAIRADSYPADEATPPEIRARADGVRTFAPDAVLVIGFRESAAVIKALADAGVALHGSAG